MKSVPRSTVSTSGRKIQDVFKSNNSQSLSTGRNKIFSVQSVQAVELMTRTTVLLPFTSKEGLHFNHSLYFTQCPLSGSVSRRAEQGPWSFVHFHEPQSVVPTLRFQ